MQDQQEEFLSKDRYMQDQQKESSSVNWERSVKPNLEKSWERDVKPNLEKSWERDVKPKLEEKWEEIGKDWVKTDREEN
jgi:hypothetical protein